MSYFGRAIGIGLSEKEKPAVIFGLSGRSSISQKRILKIKKDRYIKKVYIAPFREQNDEQKKKANLLFYDALIALENIIEEEPYIVVGNGIHTQAIANRTIALPKSENSLIGALKYFGYETDTLKTPRMAGEIVFHKSKYPIGLLGIITERQLGRHIFSTSFDDIVYDGLFKILTTYNGDAKKPKALSWKYSLGEVITEDYIKGRTAQEIADSFYHWFDKEYVVGTTAAVWNGQEWEIAVNNKYGMF